MVLWELPIEASEVVRHVYLYYYATAIGKHLAFLDIVAVAPFLAGRAEKDTVLKLRGLSMELELNASTAAQSHSIIIVIINS